LFAIKVLKKSFIAGKNAVPHILAEKKILEASVSSPFIVKMYYAFQTPVRALHPKLFVWRRLNARAFGLTRWRSVICSW
jgi:serine/threonine protein kinase